MYRTTIEATDDGNIRVGREHSTNPDAVPYQLSDIADFPDEHSFRILSVGNLTASLTPEGAVEFRPEEANAEQPTDVR